MTTICFTVLGEPVSKGSVVARVATYGDGRIVYKNGAPVAIKHDSSGQKGKRSAQEIGQAALVARNEAGGQMLRDVAIHVTLRFYTASPKGRYGTGRNAGLLKDNAPARPAKKPDVDKWARHTLDALTGVLYADDGQVVSLLCEKHYAEGDQPPRTEIEVSALLQQTVGVVMPDAQLAIAA